MSADSSPGDGAALSPRLLLPWMALVIAAMVAAVGLGADGADYPTPFAVAHAYRLLVGAELFLLLAVVPLSGGTGRARLLDLGLLLALAAPAVVATAWAADCRWPQVAASQGYLAAAAAFVAAYLRADAEGRFLSWYWLILGGLSAGGPMVGFIVEDLLRVPMHWLYGLSPFWIADQVSRPWEAGGRAAWPRALATAGLLLLLSALPHAASWRRSRLTSPARRVY